MLWIKLDIVDEKRYGSLNLRVSMSNSCEQIVVARRIVDCGVAKMPQQLIAGKCRFSLKNHK